MDEIEIIGAPQSNYVWAVRIACAEKGLAHRLTVAMPHSPETDAIHPLGKMPVLRHGAVTLFESRAICAYLDRALPGPALTPRDPLAAAVCEQWISLATTAFDPVFIRQCVFAYLFPGTPDGSPDLARVQAALPAAERLLDVLAEGLKTGAVGSEFTLVDAYLTPILFYARRLPELAPMFEARPAVAGRLDRSLARGSVAQTMPPPM